MAFAALCFITAASLVPSVLSVPVAAASNSALNPSLPPGENFNLSNFLLQLPISDGQGGVVEIQNLNDYSGYNFYTNASTGAMMLYCNDTGAHTSGSEFPRTELRNVNDWLLKSFHPSAAESFQVTTSVLVQPSTKNIVIGQLKGETDEPIILRWVDGTVYLDHKVTYGGSRTRVEVASNLNLGDLISYSIVHTGKYAVEVVVNNGPVNRVTFDKSWSSESVYFKAGNYLQDNSEQGSYGLVAITYLSDAPSVLN